MLKIFLIWNLILRRIILSRVSQNLIGRKNDLFRCFSHGLLLVRFFSFLFYLKLLPHFFFGLFFPFHLLTLSFYYRFYSVKRGFIALSRIFAPNFIFYYFSICLYRFFIKFYIMTRFNWVASRFLALFILLKLSWLNFKWLRCISGPCRVSLLEIQYFTFITYLSFYSLIFRLAHTLLGIRFSGFQRLIIYASNICLVPLQTQPSFIFIFLLSFRLIFRDRVLLMLFVFHFHRTYLKWILLSKWFILYPKYWVIIGSFVNLD